MQHVGFHSLLMGVCVVPMGLSPLCPPRCWVDGELVGLQWGEILYFLKPEIQLHNGFLGMWC